MWRAIGGQVTLLHVLETHGSGVLHREAAHALLQDLSLLARRPPGCMIVPASSRVNGHMPRVDGAGCENEVAAAILAVTDQLGTELIVMGLHGQGNLTTVLPAYFSKARIIHSNGGPAFSALTVICPLCQATFPCVPQWAQNSCGSAPATS